MATVEPAASGQRANVANRANGVYLKGEPEGGGHVSAATLSVRPALLYAEAIA